MIHYTPGVITMTSQPMTHDGLTPRTGEVYRYYISTEDKQPYKTLSVS